VSELHATPRERRLDVILQPQITSAASTALDRFYLRHCTTDEFTGAGVLRVYAVPGDEVSIGRYHLAPSGTDQASIRLQRRLTGGRVMPRGDGFVCVSLILSHRASLLGEVASPLQAYQVLNRYVRGLLEGCKMAQLAPIYPGLDSVTLRRLPFAWISMEENELGAVLFEAILANTRDFSVLPLWLDQIDRNGILKVEMVDSASVTSLQGELGVGLSVEEVGTLIQRGYTTQFAVTARTIAAAETEDATEIVLPARGEGDVARFAHHASERTQLGVFEVHVSLGPDRRIRDLMLVGDFMASASAVARLEAKLLGCACEAPAIDAVIGAELGAPTSFLLGIGQPATITRVLMRAVS